MKKKLDEFDVRQTKEFQIQRAKELGMTLEQYLGEEPLAVITITKPKKSK
jgi:hypothetical protein